MEKLGLFVYGTLRVGQERHEILPTERGSHKLMNLTGFRMNALPYGFPGIYKTGRPQDYVVIEFWEFDLTEKEQRELVELLDQIEGVDYNMYNRELLGLPTGEEGYIYTCNIKPSGKWIKDWVQFVRR